MKTDWRTVVPAAVIAMLAATPIAAQQQDVPQEIQGIANSGALADMPAPEPSATQVPVPPPPILVIPTRPTPLPSPVPSATPTAAPTVQTRAPVRETARPVRPVRSAPSPTPTPVERDPVPALSAAPAPAPRIPPVEKPSPAPASVSPVRNDRGWGIWPLAGAVAALLVIGGLWLALRGRRDDDEVEDDVAAAEMPPAEPVADVASAPEAPRFLEPVAVRPEPANTAPRHIDLDLAPRRAGLNLLSATVECELVVANIGPAPVEDIRIAAALATAHPGLDAELAEIRASPIARPVVPAFTLMPGERRVVRVVAATPREAVHAMTAANRPMFVPVVAVNLLHGAGQVARAWAVGIERVDSAKLAPFWLDVPARMHETLGARPHGTIVER